MFKTYGIFVGWVKRHVDNNNNNNNISTAMLQRNVVKDDRKPFVSHSIIYNTVCVCMCMCVRGGEMIYVLSKCRAERFTKRLKRRKPYAVISPVHILYWT